MIDLTPETAAAERRRLIDNLRFHRTEAKAAKRALDRLEETCARHGIRLIREPVRAHKEQTRARPDLDAR